MSQHCRANPCCGDRPCSGIPLPQDASGLTAHNVKKPEAVEEKKPYTFGECIDAVSAILTTLESAFVAAAKDFGAQLKAMEHQMESLSESELQVISGIMSVRLEGASAKITKEVEAAF